MIEPKRLAAILALGLAIFYAVLLISQIGNDGGWLYDSQGRPFADDFTGVYAAGTLINAGDAAAVYDWDTHRQAHATVTRRETFSYFQFPYPPTMFAMAALLAALPYALAKLGWIAATFGIYVVAARRITGDGTMVLIAAAVPAVLLNAYLGQNGFLTAGLIGLALALLGARPVFSGILMGLLTIKPHLGLLIPLALAAGGYWRTFTSAAVTALAMALVSILLFGIAPWGTFIDQLQAVGGLLGITTDAAKLQSFYGLLRTFGAPHGAAMAMHLLAAGLIAGVVIMIWRRDDCTPALKSAALVAAALLISPYLFVYDLAGLFIAQAFLLMARTNNSDQRGQASLIAAGRFVLPHVLVLLSPFVGMPLGVFAAAIVLGDAMLKILDKRLHPGQFPAISSATIG